MINLMACRLNLPFPLLSKEEDEHREGGRLKLKVPVFKFMTFSASRNAGDRFFMNLPFPPGLLSSYIANYFFNICMCERHSCCDRVKPIASEGIDGDGRENGSEYGSTSFPYSILIFVEDDIFDPMEAIFDSPMSSDSLIKSFCICHC